MAEMEQIMSLYRKPTEQNERAWQEYVRQVTPADTLDVTSFVAGYNAAEDKLLTLLERLLSVTEGLGGDEWQAISAEVADLRDGADV